MSDCASYGNYDYYGYSAIDSVCSHKELIAIIIVLIIIVNVFHLYFDSKLVHKGIIGVGAVLFLFALWRIYGYKRCVRDNPNSWQMIKEQNKKKFKNNPHAIDNLFEDVRKIKENLKI